MVVSRGLATLTELSTDLGVEDLHDLVEVMTIDAHNARALAKRQKDK